MSVTLLTQGPVATRLLAQLVAQHALLRDGPIRLEDRGGHSRSFALAQTLLTVRREPVAVLVDADSDELAYVEDRRELLESLMTGPPWAWRLIFWVPEVEILFFQDERLLLELVRPACPSARQLRQARGSPRRVLSDLLASVGEDTQDVLLQRLAPLDVSGLWRVPELRVLEEFLLERLKPQRPAPGP